MEQMLLKVGIKPEDMIEEIKTGIKRNNIGQKVERELRQILGLKKERIPFKASKPDILDYHKYIIGEIKAVSEENGRTIMFTDQIDRYILLTSKLNSFNSFNGNRPMSTMYYIGYHNSSEDEFKISEIYILGENILKQILMYDTKTTRWGLDGKLARIASTIDDNSQARIDKSITSEIMISELIKKNHKNTYIRISKRELEELCPYNFDITKEYLVSVHTQTKKDSKLYLN